MSGGRVGSGRTLGRYGGVKTYTNEHHFCATGGDPIRLHIQY